MSEQFSAAEQALVERLRRAPQPSLKVEARSAIHARLMEALDRPPVPAPRIPTPRPMVIVVAVVVMAVLIGAGVLLVLSQQPVVSVTLTPAITPTLLAPSATPSPTERATAIVTQTPLPVPMATAKAVTVIEGPVDSIAGNVIVIFNIEITLPENDPALTTIEVGDTVRVEGNSESTTALVATSIQVVTADAPTSPGAGGTSGAVWQDDGTCSHPPPDWAPANGWRRRCEGQSKEQDDDKDHGKGHK